MKATLIAAAMISAAAVLLCACELIEYHPYDVKLSGQTGILLTNCALIEQRCAGKDTLRIAHISDTQRFYDETELFVADINRRDSIDFVIHTGDITDFGLPKEYMWQRDILSRLHAPYITAIGNHDCLGTGRYAYRTMLGSDNYSLNAAFLHIVSVNTNSGEYGYPDNVPDLAFLEQDAATLPDTVTSTIVAMHVAPGMTLFNEDLSAQFDLACRSYRNLLCCICGHDHRTAVLYPFGTDGTTYYECGVAKHRSYIIYTITPNSCHYEVVEL